MADKARRRLIESTIALQRRNGVAGTGINDVVAHSGAARRSIYLNFPGGKDELVAEATRVAGRHIGRMLEAVADSDLAVNEILSAFGASWRDNLVQSDFQSGCPVAAGALAGHAAPSAPAHAGRAFSDWATAIAKALASAGVPQESAESFGILAVCAVEGALMMSISTRSTDPIDRITDHLIEVANQHIQSGSGARD